MVRVVLKGSVTKLQEAGDVLRLRESVWDDIEHGCLAFGRAISLPGCI